MGFVCFMYENVTKKEDVNINDKLRKTVSVCTSLAVGILGVLFIVFCAHLYFTGGDHPYSRDRVGSYLLPLAIPALITAGLAVWSFVLFRMSGKKEDERATLSESYRLYSYAPRFDGARLRGETKATVAEERRKRIIINSVFFSVSALICITAFVYVIFFAKFTVENLNLDMMSAFAVSLPLLAISVGVHVPRLYLIEKSAKREREALSLAQKGGIKPKGAVGPLEIKNEALIKRIIGLGVLTVALTFVVVGIFNGGMGDVLAKAVKICTECIGLG